MDDAVRDAVRKYIGARIKHAREVDGVPSAAALADMLTDYTDEEWTRSVVTNLENGRKEVTFVDLCAIAAVQQRPISWYWQDAPATLAPHIPRYPNRRATDGAPFAAATAAESVAA